LFGSGESEGKQIGPGRFGETIVRDNDGWHICVVGRVHTAEAAPFPFLEFLDFYVAVTCRMELPTRRKEVLKIEGEKPQHTAIEIANIDLKKAGEMPIK